MKKRFAPTRRAPWLTKHVRQAVFACLAALACAAPGVAVVAGAAPDQLEFDIKAAFLPKFAAYVNWPAKSALAPEDPLQLCIIGRDPFGNKIDEAATRQRIETHPLVVRRLDTTVNAEHCHIAFIGGSPKQGVKAALKALDDLPVLTVTDDRFGADRGMVHFILKDGRVRFHIDNAMAVHSELSISSRLLSIALSVNMRARA